MSLSPYFYVEKWNTEKNCYEKISLYKKLSKYAREEDKVRGFEEVDFWPWNGTHDIFSLLGTDHRGGSFDPIAGIHNGEPPMVSEEVKKKIDYFFNSEDSLESADCAVRWVTLADLYIEKLKNPKVLDYDAEWEDLDHKVYKDNPINSIIERINTFIELGDDDWDIEDHKSLIRIVYWVLN